MSANEISTDISDKKLESEIEQPTLRPQRPPPPIPIEPSIPSIETPPITPEFDIITPSIPETPNDLDQNLENTRPSLLFEFNDLFESFDYGTIRNKILTRQMITSPFTTVLWRIFLHCLPRDSSHWDQMIDSSRENYNDLVEKYLLDLQKIRELNGDIPHLNHPLSQEENSPWHQYYINVELKDNIYQDVIRTCQEISFFRQKHILDLLLRVLYIHSRYYEQTLPYRQGMHEILAVIVYLMHMESTTVNQYAEASDLMKKLYDPEYLAHDSYAIYEKIMQHLQQFYDFTPTNLGARKKASENKQILFQRSYDVQVQLNDTVMRVNAIFDRLKEFDHGLHQKLEEMGIEPMVYGIRWLRLLFGREIPFGSIPNLWTVIFCYDECFGFVDYFFLALLKEIGQLFKNHTMSEYGFCLQQLMRPNAITDVEDIIQKALELEKISRSRDLQRSSSYSPSQSPSIRSSTSEITKPISPMQALSQNPIKTNPSTSFISPSKVTKSSNVTKESEMADYPGKAIRQQLDDSFQIQKYCADFINRFISKIRNRIPEFNASNEEEVLIQLNGLEQIANVLEGTLTFDDNTLQALIDYQQKEQEQELENNNISTTTS